MTICTSCGSETDFYLCHPCAEPLLADLEAVGWLWTELQLTVTRQTSFGGGAGVSSRPAETQLPFHPRASTVSSRLQVELATWAHEIAGMRGADLRAFTAPALAEWLIRHIEAVRMHPQAAAIANQVSGCVSEALRVVDRPPQDRRSYLGDCAECETDLYARPEDVVCACPQCGTEHEVVTRRQQMLDALGEYQASAAEVSRVVSTLGVRVPEASIRSWVKRKKLAPAGWEDPEEMRGAVYRVRDVLAVASGQS